MKYKIRSKTCKPTCFSPDFNMTTKGKLKVNLEEFHMEWRIDNFLSLPHSSGEYYTSPTFLFADAYWCLNVCPNNMTGSNSEEFIGLSLNRKSEGLQIDLDCAFGLKSLNPKKTKQKQFACVFMRRNKNKTYSFSYGIPYFISRSELKDRKAELLPSDVLTVLCSLRFPKSYEDASNTEALKLSYCQEDLRTESISSYEKTYQSMKCTECSKSISLQDPSDEHYQLAGREDLESLVRDYKKVLVDGKNHDLVIKVGDKELKAHRDILKARSRVFESMLNHSMTENNSGVVDVPDCNPEAMELFLSYLYCGKVETLDESNMLELYYIADKYDMKCLREECRDFIKKSLSVTNICEILQLALRHSDEDLLEYATVFFMDHVLDIMRTVEWQSFLKDNSTEGNELLIKAFERMRNTNI